MKLNTCIPTELPLRSLRWELIADVLGKAHAAIARYDEILSSVKDPKAVFSLLTSEETLFSLQSQKVSVNLEELLLCQTVRQNELCDHGTGIVKILNYRRALLDAAKRSPSQPITFAFLCKLHGMIKKNLQGSSKDIGRFRDRQNWIGPEGCKIEEAYYYPPDVRILDLYMNNLKQYIRIKEEDPLVQLAIFFAQLLVIHPFMDGNGRVGRVLIPLILYKKKLMSTPMFYLSAYFKRHRVEYFERLFTITSENDWEGWIRFFLKGAIEEGNRHVQKARVILAAYQRCIEVVGNTQRARKAVDSLFASPIFTEEEWHRRVKIQRVLNKLEEKRLVIRYKTQPMVAVKELLAIDCV